MRYDNSKDLIPMNDEVIADILTRLDALEAKAKLTRHTSCDGWLRSVVDKRHDLEDMQEDLRIREFPQ